MTKPQSANRKGFSHWRRHWAEQLRPRNDVVDQRPRKFHIVLWFILINTAIVLSLRDYQSFQIGVYQDDASYVVLARSLIQSNEYGLMNLPGSPGPTRYPFAYPLLLAPFARLWPDQPEAMKVLSLLATLANAALLFWGWRLFSHSLSYELSLAVIALYLLSPLTIGQTRMVMSEPIFTTASLSAIILAERVRVKPLKLMGGMLLSFSIVIAAFTRTVGVILFGLVPGYWLLARGRSMWRAIVLLITGWLMVLALIFALTPVQPHDLLPAEYLAQYATPLRWGQTVRADSLGSRLIDGAEEYLTQHVRQTLIPVGGGEREQEAANQLGLPFLPALLGVLIVLLVALGLVRWVVERGMSLALMFMLGYLAIVILWPWRGPRFLYAIQPQLYLGLLLGIMVFTRALPFGRGTRIRTGFMVGIVASIIVLNLYRSATIRDTRSNVGDLEARTTWLKDHSAASDIVMSEQPQIDYIYIGRKVVPFENFNSTSELTNYLAQYRIRYVLLAPQVIWQPAYSPTYSSGCQRLQLQMERLVSAGNAQLVYADERDQIYIYHVD